jgi:hypothetical protein
MEPRAHDSRLARVDAAELTSIREQVAATGDAIQPLLLPHSELARRNAYAHIWLGISTVFGDQWRITAIASEVTRFVEWIGTNPNEDYEAFPGPATRLPPPDREGEPRESEKAASRRPGQIKRNAEPSLFDAPD